jgi:hypothetical protein
VGAGERLGHREPFMARVPAKKVAAIAEKSAPIHLKT